MRLSLKFIILLALVLPSISYSNNLSLPLLHQAARDGDAARVRQLLEQEEDQTILDETNGWAPIHWAADRGHLDVIETLIAYVPKSEKKSFVTTLCTKRGSTALHTAAANGNSNSVKLLLRLGAKRDARNNNNGIPLHFAAQTGDELSIAALLDGLTTQEQQQYLELTTSDGLTTLHIAAASGNSNVVKQLLQLGAKRDARNKDAWTPLHSAAKAGDELSIMALLDGLTTQEQQRYLELITSDGLTALHITTANKKSNVVKRLLQLRVKRDARCADGRTPLHYAAQVEDNASISALLDGLTLEEQQQYLELTTNDGLTSLHIAAANGNSNVVKQLLQLRVKRDARCNDNWTPLHYAAHAGDELSIAALLDGLSLEEQQQYLELMTNHEDSALQIAAYYGRNNAVQQLINLGAKRNARNNKGWTPLHHAACAGDKACISALLDGLSLEERKEYLESTINHGFTALHIAAANGRSNAVQQLIDLGTPVDSIASGHTILHAAILSDNPEVVSSLLNHLSPEMICHLLNMKTNIEGYRQTVLHFALKNCTNNRAVIVKTLLQAGANCTLRDSEGKTAQQVAEGIKDETCTQAIINHQINVTTQIDNLTKQPSPVVLEAGTLPGSQDTNQAEWYTPESLKMTFEATHKDAVNTHELYNCSTRLPLTGKPFQIKYLYSYLKQLVGKDREDWLTADNLPTRLCIDPLSLESHLVPYATARRLVTDFLLSGQRVWSTKFNQVRSDILNASACEKHLGYYYLETLRDETQKVLMKSTE